MLSVEAENPDWTGFGGAEDVILGGVGDAVRRRDSARGRQHSVVCGGQGLGLRFQQRRLNKQKEEEKEEGATT
jgi:hypothetical protein